MKRVNLFVLALSFLFLIGISVASLFSQNTTQSNGGKGDKQSTGEQPLFSNTKGSLLTSLGKYKTGTRSYSQYGINVSRFYAMSIQPINLNIV